MGVADVCFDLIQKFIMALSVSMEQVRQHLQQMGFHEVPDDVVRELHSELLSRVSSAAPTPPKKTAAAHRKGAPAGYEADESEWEKNDKVSLSSGRRAQKTLCRGCHRPRAPCVLGALAFGRRVSP
jgi:hypothetical protein